VTQIVDYPSLQTAVTEYLARDQDMTLIARIPTFVQLAEAKFNRMLFCRQMEQRSTALIDITQPEPQYIALPGDFQSMRRVKLKSTNPSVRLDYKSPAQMDEYRTSIGDTVNQPLFFTIFGSEIELCPTPDQDYTLEMVYRQNIPALALNLANWLLALAPDLYLYGALLESAPYIKEDERIQTWGLGFTSALNDVNGLGQMSTYNAGPLDIRISGVTP
jgi:hypothetical protein